MASAADQARTWVAAGPSRRTRASSPNAQRALSSSTARSSAERVVGGPQALDRRLPAAGQLADELVGLARVRAPAAAHLAFPRIDGRAPDARGRRAQPGEQVLAAPAQPGEAAERQQRVPERRARQGQARIQRVGDAHGLERAGQRTARALRRRHGHHDLVRRQAGAQQRRDLPGHRVGLGLRPRRLDQPHPCPAGVRGGRAVREEAALQRIQALGALQPRRRQLLDRGGALGQVGDGGRERRIGGAAGLEGQRDGDLGARRERLEQRELRAAADRRSRRRARGARPTRRGASPPGGPPRRAARRDRTARRARALRASRPARRPCARRRPRAARRPGVRRRDPPRPPRRPAAPSADESPPGPPGSAAARRRSSPRRASGAAGRAPPVRVSTRLQRASHVITSPPAIAPARSASSRSSARAEARSGATSTGRSPRSRASRKARATTPSLPLRARADDESQGHLTSLRRVLRAAFVRA